MKLNSRTTLQTPKTNTIGFAGELGDLKALASGHKGYARLRAFTAHTF